MKLKEFWSEFISYVGLKPKDIEPGKDLPGSPKDISSKKVRVEPGGHAEGATGNKGVDPFTLLEQNEVLVQPGYQYEVIPLLRKLSISNPNLSQALNNYVSLANTGHKIEFDSDVAPEKVDEMREHLISVSSRWHYGSAGMHGIINKLFSQALLAGSVCADIIPDLNLTQVDRIVLPLPESIRFIYNKTKNRYFPYQKVKNPLYNKDNSSITMKGLKPLNMNTFRYFSINGDTEVPYGNPVFLPSLGPLADQAIMLDNIKFIISQMGVMGFVQLLVEKPDQNDGESDDAYAHRLSSFLTKSKNSIKNGMRDGIMIGYKDDHEFEFNTAAASAQGVSQLFEQNESLVYSGLKQDPALSGKSTGRTETNITIVFTKLLSELSNIQLTVAKIVEYAYELELRLRGYDFRTLKVIFNRSTIQDDLKFEQSREIRIRNLRQLRMDGVISQEQYADELGYETPYQDEPVVPFGGPTKEGVDDPTIEGQKKQVREKSKDASDRKNRAKQKPQGKIR